MYDRPDFIYTWWIKISSRARAKTLHYRRHIQGPRESQPRSLTKPIQCRRSSNIDRSITDPFADISISTPIEYPFRTHRNVGRIQSYDHCHQHSNDYLL